MFVDLTVCQKRELILETLFSSRVDSVGEETTTEAFDSSNLPNESSASISDQASDGQIKDEIDTSMYADLFWNWLERVTSPSADVSRLASFTPEFLRMKDYFTTHLVLLGELMKNPVMMENKKDMEVLVSLDELMMEFRNTVSILGSWLDKDTLIVLSKKILSRRSEIARFLYKPDVWKEPEDNWSNNSQCAVNSGHGKAKEGNRSNNSQGAGKSGHRKAKENNKGKKNKGGKKGKK